MQVVSAHAQGLRLRETHRRLACSAADGAAFRLGQRRRRPRASDFAAQWLACAYPCQRFACALVAIAFGPNARQDVVTQKTISVIKKLLRVAGQKNTRSDSTLRTPEDQARIMFENLQAPPYSAFGAGYKLYGPVGDQIIDVYLSMATGLTEAQIKAHRPVGPSNNPNIMAYIASAADLTPLGVAAEALAHRDAIQAAMLQRITDLLTQTPSQRVSLHVVTLEQYARLNVIDVAPSTFTTAAVKARFIAAAKAAKADGTLSNFLDSSTGDKAYHLEVRQD